MRSTFGLFSSSRSFMTFVLMVSSIWCWCILCTSGSYNMIMVSGTTTSSILTTRDQSLYLLYPIPKEEVDDFSLQDEKSWKIRFARTHVNLPVSRNHNNNINTSLLQVRGGGSSGSGSTNINRIRIVPSTIPDATSKTKSTSSSLSLINNPFSSTTTSSNVDVKEQIDAFLTRDSRNSFIARVYAILSCQLLVTAMMIHTFGTNPSLLEWMRHSSIGPIVPIISLLLSTVAWFTMCLSTQARRSSPMKWQLLLLFTLGEAISVGFVSSFYKYRTVVTTMIVTALATSGISLYTIKQRNSKYDLSQWGATLSSFGLMLVLYGIIQVLQSTGVLPSGLLPYNEMIYGLIGATLFSGYLAYHTKLITANKFAKYQMNEKDYVFGASYVY